MLCSTAHFLTVASDGYSLPVASKLPVPRQACGVVQGTLVLSLVRPKYFIPIHGEYRQLARHARVAELVTSGVAARVTVLMAEDGDVVRFDAEGGRIVDKAPAGRVRRGG